MVARPGRDPPPRLELVSDLALWVEAHIRLADKWDGRVGAHAEQEVDWKRARPPGRGRARGGPGDRLLKVATRRRLRRARGRDGGADQTASPGGSPSRCGGEPTGAGPAPSGPRTPTPGSASVQPAESGPTPQARGGSPRGRSTDCSVATPARSRRRESRSASRKALESSSRRSTCSWRARRSCVLPQGHAQGVLRGDVVDAVGLQALEQRVPVAAGRGSARLLGAHGARACQTAPKPKNAGPRPAAVRRCPATKSSTAVSTPLRGPPSRAAERG